MGRQSTVALALFSDNGMELLGSAVKVNSHHDSLLDCIRRAGSISRVQSSRHRTYVVNKMGSCMLYAVCYMLYELDTE